MVITLKLVFFIISIICFILGAVGVPARVAWDQLGKAFFVAGFAF